MASVTCKFRGAQIDEQDAYERIRAWLQPNSRVSGHQGQNAPALVERGGIFACRDCIERLKRGTLNQESLL